MNHTPTVPVPPLAPRGETVSAQMQESAHRSALTWHLEVKRLETALAHARKQHLRALEALDRLEGRGP